jgi:hypothetical protein
MGAKISAGSRRSIEVRGEGVLTILIGVMGDPLVTLMAEPT